MDGQPFVLMVLTTVSWLGEPVESALADPLMQMAWSTWYVEMWPKLFSNLSTDGSLQQEIPGTVEETWLVQNDEVSHGGDWCLDDAWVPLEWWTKVQLLYSGNWNNWQCVVEHRFVEQSVLDGQLQYRDISPWLRQSYVWFWCNNFGCRIQDEELWVELKQ